MPFYEYKCTHCGHEEEVLQKVSDKPLKKCSECGKSTMKKQVSAAAFRLKGSGWYETDFKSGNKKNIQQSDSRDGSGKKVAEKEKPAAAKKSPANNRKKAE